MIYTGVDWSGDGSVNFANASDRGLLAIAFASISEEDRTRLHGALADLRGRYRFDRADVFKHVNSSQRLRAEFMGAIVGVGVEVRVRLIDKACDWPPPFATMKSPQRVASSIAMAASSLPV
jgi:hypothetical protein